MLFRRTSRATIAMAALLLVAVGVGWAQADGASMQDALPESVQSNSTSPSVQTTQPPPYELNPPLVGLNVRPLQPQGAEARSFLIPGAQITQALDTDQGDNSSQSSVHGVTRGLGSLSLQRLWRRYDLAADYLGGVAYYSDRPVGTALLQLLNAEQHISWKRGQFAVRDSFSYLPEGNFGAGSFGGSGAGSLAGGFVGGLAGLGILGPGQFASLGQQPRITNVAIADVTQFLSPRSSLSAVGSYGLVHFTDNQSGLINSHQVVAQGAYDYQLNRRDQIVVLYAYQGFRYPSSVGNNFNTNLVNVLVGRRITGRMEFIAGGGPQFTNVGIASMRSTDRLTFSGRVALRYRIQNSELALTFFRYDTNGSGFFAGATTNVLRFVVNRQLGRRWSAYADVGYSHNSRIAPSPIGSSAQTFDYVYVGGSLHRQLGRELSAFVGYQFNNVGSDASLCISGFSCNRTSQREVALIGLDWHPRPIRID